LKQLAKIKGCQLYIPKFEYCTDNAAMIAIAGYFKYFDEDFAEQSETPSARLLF
jgi:N6-L-threonylcarbamoyladenine synthase